MNPRFGRNSPRKAIRWNEKVHHRSIFLIRSFGVKFPGTCTEAWNCNLMCFQLYWGAPLFFKLFRMGSVMESMPSLQNTIARLIKSRFTNYSNFSLKLNILRPLFIFHVTKAPNPSSFYTKSSAVTKWASMWLTLTAIQFTLYLNAHAKASDDVMFWRLIVSAMTV